MTNSYAKPNPSNLNQRHTVIPVTRPQSLFGGWGVRF